MIGQTSLRRYALKQAIKVAKDPNIDPAIKCQLIKHMSNTAISAPAAQPPPAYGRLVYRLIAIALGLVAILSVVFSFVLLLGKHRVDSAFYTLGSAAVGALGGVFSPQHASGEDHPGPGDAGGEAGGPGAGEAGGPGAGAARRAWCRRQPAGLVQEQPAGLVQEQPAGLVQPDPRPVRISCGTRGGGPMGQIIPIRPIGNNGTLIGDSEREAG